VNSINNTRELH